MTEDQKLTQREREILTELAADPAGLQWTELRERVEMPPSTFSNHLDRLKGNEEGFKQLVTHDQENLYKLTDLAKDIEEMKKFLQIDVQEIKKILQDLTNIWVFDMSNLLLEYEKGEIDSDEFFQTYSEFYSMLTDALGVAYSQTKDFGERTRKRLMMYAFELCLEAEGVVEAFIDEMPSLDLEELRIYQTFQQGVSVVSVEVR